MRVFQIGAAGGVGRRLATLLTEHGDRVTGKPTWTG
jgi:NAD(P)-dependent dehydrogenase (short-subunit alcohol dehydrogenase family)